ncbi:MAG: hypothetical protein OXC53_06515, partial [Rhodobacteraceae bacterium]|nr:hypothetical protein [Paracoccaceae bacterium]
CRYSRPGLCPKPGDGRRNVAYHDDKFAAPLMGRLEARLFAIILVTTDIVTLSLINFLTPNKTISPDA